MKPTELRIGNLFDFSYSQDGYLAVEEIRKENEGFKGYYAVFRNGSIRVLIEEDCLYPIPLTEEWLLRFDWNGYKQMNINSYFKIDEGGCIWYCNDFTGIVISYVHQLQNLYFALTGEELTMK